MTLNVVYPKLVGNTWDQTSEGPFVQTAEIRLGGLKAGSRYRTWWWGGFVGGVLLITLSSILLVRLSTGMCKLAQPTNIFAPGEGDDEEEAPEVLPADQPRRGDEGGIVRRD